MRGTRVATSVSDAAICPVSRQEAAMRISRIGGPAIAHRRRAPTRAERPTRRPGSARSIAIEARRRANGSAADAPSLGAFLAHLIATRMQAPQTRARRRAEPEEAIAVYRSMTQARVPPSARDLLRQTRQALIPDRAAVLARVGAADQHAALPVDLDRLSAAERQRAQHTLWPRAFSPSIAAPARRARPRSSRPRRTCAAHRSRPARPCRSRPCW